MSSLETSPRASRTGPVQSTRQELASHSMTASDGTNTNPASPRHARSSSNMPRSPQELSYASRSVRSNIHDILSSDSQPSPRKRPHTEMDSVNNACLSEPSLKRSRENSPTKPYAQAPGSSRGQHQTPAYALAGTGRHSLSNTPRLSNRAGTDEQGRSRKVSLENSQEEGPVSVSDGSAEPDSSPSSSHQDRDPGYNTNAGASGHQQMPQERPPKKRNFANRTKTGCLTCRERKKKCDEGKPLCKNCERGGFRCKGYMQPGTTFRRSTLSLDQQTAVATVRSVERDTSPLPAQQVYPRHASPGYQHQRSSYTSRSEEEGRSMMRAEHPQEGGHSRTISATEASPIYAPLQNQAPTPMIQHYPPRHPPPGVYHREAPVQCDTRPAEPVIRYPPIYQSQTPQAHKENMLRGWPYDLNDQLLEAERLECGRTLERFHAVSRTSTRFDPVWREHATAIFEPRRRRTSIISSPRRQASNPATYTFPEPSSNTTPLLVYPGYLGENVTISNNFQCDYGYNIRIADNVHIGENCRIKDSAIVDIGPGTFIDDDVLILTSDPEPYVPGQQRPLFRSRRVLIGEGCYIGARVIIMPGASIAPGTRIRPGLTVQEAVGVGVPVVR